MLNEIVFKLNFIKLYKNYPIKQYLYIYKNNTT